MKFIIKITIVSCLILFATESYSQVYDFNLKENKWEIIASLTAQIGIQTYDILRPVEVIHEYKDINRDNIWKFDRSAVNQNSKSAAHASDIFLYSSMSLPLLLALTKNESDQKIGNVLLMGLHGFIIESSLNSIAKIWVERPRPFVYGIGESYLFDDQSKTDTKSFYSGHTATVAYFSFFTASVFSDLNPNSSWRPMVWILASTAPAITAYLRYKAGRHFPSDVITGYVVGGLFGYLVPKIYKNKNIALMPSSNGLGLVMKF